MAKKFSIIQNATFKQTVKIPRIGGEPIDVEFEYKYLTRPQISKLQDEWDESSRKMIAEWKEKGLENTPLFDITEDEIKHNIKQLQDIVVGWNFDEPLDEENIRALVESSIGATDVVISAYHQAYQKAKLGN